MKTIRTLIALAAVASGPALAAPTIGGCPVFPRDSVWNAKVDTLPVHPRSAAWVANVRVAGDGATRSLKADFGSGLYPDPADDPLAAAPIGIPWVTVTSSQPKIAVTFTDYGDESDSAVGVPAVESPPGTFKANYPIPSNAPIEGEGPQTPANAGGDRHVLVIDTTNCILYETGNNYRPGVYPGVATWAASGGAIWDLRSVAMRPSGWTSADAAGLPLFPGLARYEEVAAGVIEHALRFTADRTQRAFIWPARHQAGSTTNVDVAPMGARFRLKASTDISGLPLQARILAQAMKTYGIILADNGSSWFVSGAPHASWNNSQLAALGQFKGSDFEAVDTSSLIVNPNTMATPPTTVTVAIAKSGPGSGTITSNPAGVSCGATCTADVPMGAPITLTALAAAGSVFTGWSGGGCAGNGNCTISPSANVTVTASFVLVQGPPALLTNNTGLDFGGQSVQTTSLPHTLWLTNGGGGTVTVSNVSSNAADFAVTTPCATLASGESCPIDVRFTPTGTAPRNATLSIVTSSGSPTFPMTGSGELSLVTHFYQAILNREPDGQGKTFWQGEATRMSGLGANINETWFVMAGYFFNSAEYLAANKGNAAFVTDLYNTFFNRGPDAGGLNFWVGQIQSGLPREVVLFSFMFSTEFASFTQGIFGNTAARPEVNLVVDFFRGILNRLPDTSSFNFWLGQVRTAQCQGSNAVLAQVDSMSSAFIFNPEYSNRQRNTTQFVTDMYYSFLRRGGDLQGVQFWINQLQTGAKTTNTVRSDFIATPEFAQRVQAVINAGCATGP